ncbi:hypothetical protein QJS04_geneDACA023876 [Acorus gramineus]|uniref:Retrovirus-related Pol polyprotein from transposon TNT 1-94-like beta-barrel domain-containing protein n=1 Tax=Acorus gramineus TaxID=55184 RepID=A0AAV9BNC6_ACOGR|nr:hypothetical protein QJS04_geneDACA023876 [Acorus gramineus]
MSCTNATLDPSLASQVIGLFTSRDVWITLSQLCLQQSRAQKSVLRGQLNTITKGSLSMAQYLQKIKNLCGSLTAISESISDSDLITYTLNGLGPKYGPFVTSIETRCQLCQKPNHTAARCHFRYSVLRNSNLSQSFAGLHLGPTQQHHHSQSPPLDNTWIPDSGATTSVTFLQQSDNYEGLDQVIVGDGKSLSISSIGSSSISASDSSLHLNNVLVVPGITKNLLSVARLSRDNNCSLEFFPWGSIREHHLSKE